MLLTITTTHQSATDLGYLLHKNPARPQSFELSFGQAHVFYPEAAAARCTAALVLDVDPIGLVRRKRGAERSGFDLGQYVNDRPYVASSFMSVAISNVYGTALAGRSKDRPELVTRPIPLQAKVTALPCRGGEALLRALFAPLGYEVTVETHPLDETFPDWGQSRYFNVSLAAEIRLQELLSHLYVLIPVLDDQKHYWVDQAEIDKLLHHGQGWLAAHPRRSQITRRYLAHRHSLTREALTRLLAEETPDSDEAETQQAQAEVELEAPLSLHEQRLQAVTQVLLDSGARRVLDLGCGEGRLIRKLLREPAFAEIVGMDAAYRQVEIARERLRLDRLPDRVRSRVTLLHGSLIYRDQRLAGYDVAAVVEVIEHLDPARLAAFERVVFEFARPSLVAITTPNVEYNVRFPTLSAGKFRHSDHRFEWTRAEFQTWADKISARYGYQGKLQPIGSEDGEVGAPSQMGVFRREQ